MSYSRLDSDVNALNRSRGVCFAHFALMANQNCPLNASNASSGMASFVDEKARCARACLSCCTLDVNRYWMSTPNEYIPPARVST